MLSYAVVAADEGNLLIEGPAQHPQLDPFDIRVLFNEQDMVAGDRAYGAFSIGTDPANPGIVGTVPVNLVRLPDDVVKSVSSAVAEPSDTIRSRLSRIRPTRISPTRSSTSSLMDSPTCRDRQRVGSVCGAMER